jgi:hypothetical protein
MCIYKKKASCRKEKRKLKEMLRKDMIGFENGAKARGCYVASPIS